MTNEPQWVPPASSLAVRSRSTPSNASDAMRPPLSGSTTRRTSSLRSSSIAPPCCQPAECHRAGGEQQRQPITDAGGPRLSGAALNRRFEHTLLADARPLHDLAVRRDDRAEPC